jgi:hypothetical protein
MELEHKFPEYLWGHYLERTDGRPEHDFLWNKAVNEIFSRWYDVVD